MSLLATPHTLDPVVGIDAFKGAMGRLAGAVTVITAGRGPEARGLTATAVCSVAASPPTLLICVNRSGEAHDAIARTEAFCVNVLADRSRTVADRFAGRFGNLGAEKFADAAWSSLVTGAPALDEALVAIDCRLAETVEAHSHTVFFGTVVGVRLGAALPPLLHFDRAYRTLS
ncbi:flavin reductase family protein [Siculibacillus lacustris]|nr:flavin reductase family protein [Siculibacillus lacustris]